MYKKEIGGRRLYKDRNLVNWWEIFMYLRSFVLNGQEGKVNKFDVVYWSGRQNENVVYTEGQVRCIF